MVLNEKDIRNFLPHEDPFLFVEGISVLDCADSIKDLSGGVAIGHYHVREDLDILRGHFPGDPVLPGVIQIEMMAQTSALTTYNCFNSANEEKIEVALLKVENSRFRKRVLPGMDLQIEAKCTRVRGNIITYECRLLCNDELYSEAVLLASCKDGNKR